MNKFNREHRYIVFKRSDIAEALGKEEREYLAWLQEKVVSWRAGNDKQRFDCLVVESDWPEYETTWLAIERRVARAAPPATAETDAEERERLRLAGISTAALGYWREGDTIHPDYDTPALRDVAKLYAKYDELFQAAAPPAVTYAPSRESVMTVCDLLDKIRDSHGHWGGWSGIPNACEEAVNALRYSSDVAPPAVKVPAWQLIETAPKETEILVGRYVNDEWRICQSGFYYDAGINSPDAHEPPYWYWCCDWDNGGVTDDEGPTHWQPLLAAPSPDQKGGG